MKARSDDDYADRGKLVLVPPQPSIAATESSMDNVLKVKAFVDGLPDLYQAMRPAVSPLLTKIRGLFRPEMIAPLRTLIYETFHEDVTHTKKALDQRNQRAFAVKVAPTAAASLLASSR